MTLVMGNRNQLQWDLPALDSFELTRAIYRIPRPAFTAQRDELVDLLDIGALVDKPVRNLSLGERMKAEIANSLLHRPAVLFLDEPTIGLDVAMQRRLRTFVAEYNQRHGATVMLTSHYMADVEALCRRVIMIDSGRLLFDGALTELSRRFAGHKTIVVTLREPTDLSSYGEVIGDGGTSRTTTPFGWEQRIRGGRFSAQLIRPLHPIHYDLAFFAGWKVVVIILWLPLAAVLTLVFRPSIDPRPGQVAAFAVAIWGAYPIRSLLLWMLGMVTFWTTRIGAVFEVYFAAELLLSGRVVPMSLMPTSVRSAAHFLPFESTFGFPITALVGPITGAQLVEGLARQTVWIGIGSLGVAFMWRRAVRVYTAV